MIDNKQAAIVKWDRIMGIDRTVVGAVYDTSIRMQYLRERKKRKKYSSWLIAD